MHIALVNQWYPPETGGGGVATHNFYFANALVEAGHQVSVIASRFTAQTPTRSVQNGVKVIRVTSPNLYRWRRLPLAGRQYRFVQAAIYSRRVCRALAALHQELPVDIAEFADVNAEGLFWRNGMSRLLVVRCHMPAWILARTYTAVEAPYSIALLGRAEKAVIRRADLVSAPSRSLANLITAECELPANHIHVTANALDTRTFAPGPMRAPAEVINVLWVGRLERAKGADLLIEAIPGICERVAGVRFIIVGGARPHPQGGTYETFMRARFGDLIAVDRIDLRGAMAQDDLPDVYRISDIAVVPSLLFESFSFTVAQAMAYGLPVVASRIGGIPETLDDGRCGLLVSPNNTDEFVAAVVQLATHPEQRRQLGQAARERAVSVFTAETVARQSVGIYEQALHN